jgi:two-component sensor histidine kinase
MLKQHIIVLVIFLFLPWYSWAQTDSTLCITFDFNEHEVKEKNGLVTPKGIGTSLVNDRFGNERSAVYLHGNPDSYLNLGTSAYLKPESGTISIWINLDRYIYAGRGGEVNTIIGTKNGPGDDFNQAYNICYEFKIKRLLAVSHQDSTLDVNIKSEQDLVFNKWYHLVYTFDRSKFAFYVNGILQQTAPKRFDIKYLENDSVIVGNSANKKNNRWSQGIFDDIQIFHRAITPEEVLELYHSPNPNETRQLMLDMAKYAAIVLFFVLIIIVILVRNKRRLKKQKEQFELQSRISELEIKVIKNQMNPHFISNCLTAIQDLIYTENYKKANQYIAKFSYFMRQVLNYSDKTYITLAEELSIVKLDVELEQLRFKDEFEFELNIAEVNPNDVLIPSLITQPFIENAIWHGLLPLKGIRKACLKINIYETGNSVFMEIEDNGVGRKQEAISENSKGTKLVMDKIESINRLMKENDYRLEIIDLFDDAGKQAGTKVVLRLKDSKH